jgi:outer membrane protein assembly factor BamD
MDAECNFKGGYDIEGFERSWLNEATFGLLDPPKAPQFDYRPGLES